MSLGPRNANQQLRRENRRWKQRCRRLQQRTARLEREVEELQEQKRRLQLEVAEYRAKFYKTKATPTQESTAARRRHKKRGAPRGHPNRCSCSAR